MPRRLRIDLLPQWFDPADEAMNQAQRGSAALRRSAHWPCPAPAVGWRQRSLKPSRAGCAPPMPEQIASECGVWPNDITRWNAVAEYR